MERTFYSLLLRIQSEKHIAYIVLDKRLHAVSV